MSGKEAKQVWERVRTSSDKIEEQVRYFPYVIDGILSALEKNDERKEKLKTFKEELGRISVSVSEYDTWNKEDRYILIKMPSYFSLPRGGFEQKHYSFGGNYVQGHVLADVILTLEDFQKKIIKVENEIMPGEPSSAAHQGTAYMLIEEIDTLKTWILEFTTEL